MILVWGSRTDSPVARVLEALELKGADVCHVDENALTTLQYDIVFGSSSPSGWIESHGRRIALEDFRGIYVRPGERVTGSQNAASVLLAIASGLSTVVVNRPAAGRSNASKPYQISLIQQAGFEVPETLVTTDPTAARAFLREHGRLIYKSLSGIRSIVATLDASDESRLEDVRTGPVQLQAYVQGLDVRVHIVRDRWFACSVESTAADYRYAGAVGSPPGLSAYELPENVGRRIAAMVGSMNLLVAGVDLRLTPDDTWVCFEVNPSPGFPWYEETTGHEIAEAIATLLLS